MQPIRVTGDDRDVVDAIQEHDRTFSIENGACASKSSRFPTSR